MPQNKAEKALQYVHGLKADQEKVVLSGAFNHIAEYKAATTMLRNLERVIVQLEKIFGEHEDE